MNITYEVRDLLIVLLKKWYIILAITILCGVVAQPLASRSYNSAVQNYNKFTKNTVNVAINETINGTTFYEVKLNLASTGDDKQFPVTLAKNIVDFSKIDYVIESFSNIMKDELENYNVSTLSQISVTNLNDLPIIMIKATNMEEEIYLKYVELFPQIMQEAMKNIIDEKFSINKVDSKIIPSSVRTLTPSEQELQNKVAFNNLIFKKPDIMQSRIKIMGTASIFGFMMACLMLLIIDFIKTSRKARAMMQ